MITITREIHVTRGRAGRKSLSRTPEPPVDAKVGHIPRISKLMALAIRYEGLLHDGTVSDQSELARLAQVTQPRMTQIMNLNHLAPDIIEELLFLPEVAHGRETVHEKMLRPIAALRSWEDQRQMWEGIKARL